jgi:hypothetical protein
MTGNMPATEVFLFLHQHTIKHSFMRHFDSFPSTIFGQFTLFMFDNKMKIHLIKKSKIQ